MNAEWERRRGKKLGDKMELYSEHRDFLTHKRENREIFGQC